MTKKEIEFNTLKNEIFKWLKNLKKVFEEISKRKLLLYRNKVNHEITLKTKKIKSLLLILTQSKKQKIVKEYLNEMIRKE